VIRSASTPTCTCSMAPSRWGDSVSFHPAGPFQIVADAAAHRTLRSLKTLLARATQIDYMGIPVPTSGFARICWRPRTPLRCGRWAHSVGSLVGKGVFWLCYPVIEAVPSGGIRVQW